jgi:hypothetical protein
MSTGTKKTLTTAQIDRIAAAWNDLDEQQKAIDEAREDLRSEILDCVELHGELAEGASKTELVEGEEWDLRVTYGESTSVNQKAVREFLTECPKALGRLIFRAEEKFILLETPDRLAGGAELSVRARRLFTRAVVIKPRSPRVEARSRLAEKKSAAS